MQNQKPSKLFAFQLATQRDQQTQPAQQWKARDGVSVGGCTYPIRNSYEMRESSEWGGIDAGVYC